MALSEHRGLSRTKPSAPARRWPLSPSPTGERRLLSPGGSPILGETPHRQRPPWARSSPGGPGTGEEGSEKGNPELPPAKTPRERETRRGGAGGERGLWSPSGLSQVAREQEHHLATYHPGRPATGGNSRIISLSPAPLFPGPGPRESWRGRAAAGAPRGGRHRPLPLTPAGTGTRGGGNRDSRASGCTVSSRLPVSASIRGSETREPGFCC